VKGPYRGGCPSGSQRQGRHREGSSWRKLAAKLRLEEHEADLRLLRLSESANDDEARATKGQSSKSDKCAGKVNVLTWGDLLAGRNGKPDREVRQSEQESAEAIVPEPSRGEGPNIKRG